MNKILVIILAIIILGGFYFMLDNIHNLQNEMKNLELALTILQKNIDSINLNKNNLKTINQTNEQEALPPQATPQTEIGESDKSDEVVVIPTAIIFETTSSPALLPQTKITITIENLTKDKNGRITINIKAYSSEASAYSALELRDVFQLVNLESQNQKPIAVNGSFQSIPPKSSIRGSVFFQIEPNKNSVILQVGPTENAIFYEFDFTKKTYKEVILG